MFYELRTSRMKMNFEKVREDVPSQYWVTFGLTGLSHPASSC